MEEVSLKEKNFWFNKRKNVLVLVLVKAGSMMR